VVQVVVDVEHHMVDKVVLVHKEILVDQEVIRDKVHLVEEEVSKLVEKDVVVEEDQAEMVVHIFHMVVLLDITSVEVEVEGVTPTHRKVTDEMVVVEVVQVIIQME
jgi:hypothetical protein